jgi:hypothetical protein
MTGRPRPHRRRDGHRRFAPMGLWTLTGCGKPWTATKSSTNAPAHRFPQALGSPAHGRRPSTSVHRPCLLGQSVKGGFFRCQPLDRPATTDYRRFAPTAP